MSRYMIYIYILDLLVLKVPTLSKPRPPKSIAKYKTLYVPKKKAFHQYGKRKIRKT